MHAQPPMMTRPRDPRPLSSRHAVQDYTTLQHQVLTLIERSYAPLDASAVWPRSLISRETYADLARRVLRFQVEQNSAYARYCRRLRVDVHALDDPLCAPPVPTDAFKRPQPLTSFDPSDAVVCFRSSGTTQRDRGQHHIKDLRLMRAAITSPFQRYMLPDLRSIRMLALAPRHETQPDSSLYFMLDELTARFGAPGSGHFIDGSGQLDSEGLLEAMRAAVSDDVPVFLLGPSFAFVHLLDALGDAIDVALPPGSRLFETGGFKGKSRVVARDKLHQLLVERLGLAPDMIAGEYGMSELSSQLYEPSIRHALRGATLPRRYLPPPWCAVQILDPQRLTPVPTGELGLVSLLDLANLGSVAAILTGDLGRFIPSRDHDAPEGWHGLPEDAAGLVLLGRARGAAAKGCSLAMDMLIER